MKKKILYLMLALTISFVGASPVSAARVVKYYKYDVNTITGIDSNYHGYQYINIPSWSKYSSSSRQKIGGGWNYDRYQHTNYYTGGY